MPIHGIILYKMRDIIDLCDPDILRLTVMDYALDRVYNSFKAFIRIDRRLYGKNLRSRFSEAGGARDRRE